MTGQQIIDLIRENGLEDFEINISFSEIDPTPDAPWGGYNVRRFEITGLGDIGHSDKTFKMGIKEI